MKLNSKISQLHVTLMADVAKTFAFAKHVKHLRITLHCGEENILILKVTSATEQ